MATKAELEQALMEQGLFQPSPAKSKGTDVQKEAAAVGGGGFYVPGSTGPAAAPPGPTRRAAADPNVWVQPTDEKLPWGTLPTERTEFRSGTSADAFNKARGSATQLETEVMAAQSLTGDYDEIYTPEEHKAAQEPGALESIYRVLEPFDDPRRALWMLYFEGMSLAPDPREGGVDPSMSFSEVWETADETGVADSIAWLQGNLMSVALEHEIKTLQAPGWAVEEMEDKGTLTPGSRGEDISAADVADKMAQALWESLATGELADAAWNETDMEARWLYGVGDGAAWQALGHDQAPHPRGVHILNASMTKNEAMMLADSTDPTARTLGYMMGSDVGRELLGAAMEVAIDPLWLAGPAKGAEAVSVGAKTFTVAEPLIRAAGALEALQTGSKFQTVNELRQLVVRGSAMVGDAESVVRARKLMTEGMELAEGTAMMAMEEVRLAKQALAGKASVAEEASRILNDQLRVLNSRLSAAKEAGRSDQVLRLTKSLERVQTDLQRVLSSPAEATSFLQGHIKQEAKLARLRGEQADALRTALSLESTPFGAAKGMVTEQGRLAYHVPFGKETRYVFDKGLGAAVAQRVTELAPRPLLMAGSQVKDTIKPWTVAGLESKIAGVMAETGMAAGDAAKMLPGTDQWALAFHQVTGKASMLPRWVWTQMNTWFGSRFIQPLVATVKMEAEAMSYGARGATIAKLPGVSRWMTSLRKADPGLWDAYMGAVTSYMARVDALEGSMRVDWDRVVENGKLALKMRKRVAGQQLPKVEQRIDQLRGIGQLTDRQRQELLVLQEQAAKLKHWKSDAYDIQSVLVDAGAHIEQGSGTLALYPELTPVIQSVQEMMRKVAEATGQERTMVAQALVNMERFAAGDPRRHLAFQDEVSKLLAESSQDSAQHHATVEQVRRAAAQELSRLRMAKSLFTGPNQAKLVQAMEMLKAQALGKPVDQVRLANVKAILNEVFRDDPTALREVLSYAALVTKSDDTSRAFLELAHIVDPRLIEGFKTARELAPGAKGTAQSLRMGIAKYLDRTEEQIKALRKAFTEGVPAGGIKVGDKVVAPGMPAPAVKRMLLDQAEGQLAKAKALVGGEQWDAFMAWWGAGSKAGVGVPDGWAKAGPIMDRSSLLRRLALEAEDAITGVGKASDVAGPAGRDAALRMLPGMEAERLGAQAGAKRAAAKGITEKELVAERLRQLVVGQSDDLAVGRLKQALRDIFGHKHGHNAPHSKALDAALEKYARRLLPELKKGNPKEVNAVLRAGRTAAVQAFDAAKGRLGSMTKAKVAELGESFAGRQAALQEKLSAAEKGLLETTPRIPKGRKVERERLPLPDELSNGEQWAKLDDWEASMWQSFRDLTDGLSDRERLMVAFSSLSELPKILDPKLRKSIEAAYPVAMGQRFGDLPVELQSTVKEMRRFIEGYEELYQKHGMRFMKSPEEMLRVWGVAGYVPHIATKESLLKAGGPMEYVGAVKGGYKTAASRGGVEGALSMGMDARKLRQIDGTIAEINAMRRDSDLVMTLDPMAVLARYSQANKAVSAKEFVLTMMRGNVIQALRSTPDAGGLRKSVAMLAAEQDMVPLFGMRQPILEKELLFAGDAASWRAAGVGPEEVLETIEQYSRQVKEGRGGVFATWFQETPELDAIRKVEDFYAELRAREFFKGSELSDVTQMRAAGMEWKTIATKLNERAMKVDPAFGAKAKIDPASLAHYFAEGQEGWRLYVPRVVAESMEEIFGTAGWQKKLQETTAYQWGQALNTWWKTRVTVMSLTFSGRNAISNVVSNLFDLGAGALNPSTNMKGAFLSQAVIMAERYGSIEEAARLLAGPLPQEILAKIPPAKRAAMQARHAMSQRQFRFILDEVPSVLFGNSWLKEGIDLGDGMLRPLDEALLLMRDNGVTSQAFTQFVDLANTERHMLDALKYGTGATEKVARVLDAVEDVVMVTLPTLMTATGGVPMLLGLPKKFGGEVVARSVENQARIANFIGNMKRSGSVGTSAEHVQKFLFNYGDLTSSQKSVMRLVFPFFTWNQKNMMLQAELMQQSPVLYSQFWRILMEDAPRIVEAANAQAAGVPYAPPQTGTMREEVKAEPHRLSAVKIPIPFMENTYFTGFGIPQEAFVEKIGLMFGMVDPQNWSGPRSYESRNRRLRILGETHFLLRFIAEVGFQHHSFYDKPISELTNGRLIAQTIAPLRMFGPHGQMMHAYMQNALGLHIINDYDAGTRSFASDPIISGQANHLFGSLPWTRVFRDAAAMTSIYATSMAADTAKTQELGLTRAYEEVPLWIRFLDAISGIQVVQHDPSLQDTLRRMRLQEAVRENMEQRGAIREYSSSYVDKD